MEAAGDENPETGSGDFPGTVAWMRGWRSCSTGGGSLRVTARFSALGKPGGAVASAIAGCTEDSA